MPLHETPRSTPPPCGICGALYDHSIYLIRNRRLVTSQHRCAQHVAYDPLEWCGGTPELATEVAAYDIASVHFARRQNCAAFLLECTEPTGRPLFVSTGWAEATLLVRNLHPSARRSTVHALLEYWLQHVGGRIAAACVTDYAADTNVFTCTIAVNGSRPLEVACRISDGVSLAIAAQCQILVSRSAESAHAAVFAALVHNHGRN